MLLGEKIKHLREKEGLTQEMLSIETGIPRSTLSITERGHYTTLGPNSIKKLAVALNTTIQYLSNETMEVTSMERNKQETVSIGKKMKSLRKKKNLSQLEVSKILKISPAQYSRIELGQIDIRLNKQEKIKNDLIQLFPAIATFITNINKNNNEQEKEVAVDMENKSNILDYNEFKKDDTTDIIGDVSEKIDDINKTAKALPNGIEFELPSVPSKGELDFVLSLIPMSSELNSRNLAIMNLYEKGDLEGLKQFIPSINNDFEGKTINRIKIPEVLSDVKHDEESGIINSILDKEETKAEKEARCNFQLLLFDNIHNKIMYYAVNNKSINADERDVIEEEIKLYRSVTGDPSNILELKLSKVKVCKIFEV